MSLDDQIGVCSVCIGGSEVEEGFAGLVERLSGQKLSECYQCGECTAGCPAAFAMDLTPNQVTRMVQAGLADEVLRSKTIWLCAGCETCAARCPKLIETSRVMDALRQIAAARNIPCPEPAVAAFHQAFLGGIERRGRVHELGMVIELKLRTKQFFSDVGVGLGLALKGKLSPFSGAVKDRASVRGIFSEARATKQSREQGREGQALK